MKPNRTFYLNKKSNIISTNMWNNFKINIKIILKYQRITHSSQFN